MKRRDFLKLVPILVLTGCHIPVVGNSPEEIRQRKKLHESERERLHKNLEVALKNYLEFHNNNAS